MFCDNYLEIVKDRLYNPEIFGEDETNSARYCLYKVLLAVLKLMAPIMPHITEEIYSLYFAQKEGKKFIHLSDWPIWNEVMIDNNAEIVGDKVVEIVGEVRKYKSDKNLPLNASLKWLEVSVSPELSNGLTRTLPDLKSATKAEDIGIKVDENEKKIKLNIGL